VTVSSIFFDWGLEATVVRRAAILTGLSDAAPKSGRISADRRDQRLDADDVHDARWP